MSSPPIHFKFIRPTLTKRFSLFANEQNYHALLGKLKSLSGGNFKFLEVQDVDGDWIRVDTSDEWEYMTSLLQQNNATTAIQVRDGHEWQQHEERKNTESSGPQETKTSSASRPSSGGSTSSSSSSASSSGINAQDIARDVVASVLPTLVGVVKNNPQLLSTVVSTVGTIGTQGSHLLQSNILPSLVGMASYATSGSGSSSARSNNNNQSNSSQQQQNSNSNNTSGTTPEAMISSILSQLVMSAAGAATSSSSSGQQNNNSTNANQRNNLSSSTTSSSGSSSSNFGPTLSQIFTPEHIQQGLLMGESFMKNLQQTYVNPQPKTETSSSSSTDNKSSTSSAASVAPSAPPQYPNSPTPSSSTTSTVSSPAPEVQVDENNVALLVTMGFLDRDQNRRALRTWHNNVNRAVQQLLHNPYF